MLRDNQLYFIHIEFQQFSLLEVVTRDSERSNNEVFSIKYIYSIILTFCDISDDMERISVSGTSFLERVLCMEKSFMPRCCFVFPHNSLFSLVLIFPLFCVKSLRSQTLLIGGSRVEQEVQVPKKCTCIYAKRP